MAVKNGRELCGSRIEAECADVVEKVEVVTFEEEDIGFGQAAASALAIHVAPHCVHRSNFCEQFENRSIANVAKVKDVVNAS